MATFRRSRGRPPSEGLFTPSEERVLELIRQGKTNSEIANELRISVAGVKYHVTNLLGKVGVQDRAALARWRGGNQRAGNGRGFGLGWSWPIVLAGTGTGAVLVVAAVVVAAFVMNGDDAPAAVADAEPTALPTSTAQLQITATALKPQPPLREAASGNGWRLLLADDGLGLPPVAERVLAVAYDGPEPRVDVLGADGRIAARVETGSLPMARLNPVTDELLVSDYPQLGPRLLVFDLDEERLTSEVPLGGRRANFTVPWSSVWVSDDGRWFYWREWCPEDGAPACDEQRFRAIDLRGMRVSDYSAPLPFACMPAAWPTGEAALVAVCLPGAGNSAWRVDASTGIAGRAESIAAPPGVPGWSESRAGDTLLEFGYTNVGSLTSLTLTDISSGARLAGWPLDDAWGAHLLDERAALLLRPDGRLERVDLLTGIGEELPYAIEPGNQGLEIRFYR